MLYKNKPPFFIGHRGSPLKYIENTPQSLLCAFNDGADGVELDVQITNDMQIIVFHDDYIIDLDNKKHIVADLSYKQINDIYLSISNEQIFLLTEVLTTLPPNRIINIEIKSNYINNYRFVNELGKIINESYNTNFIIVSSFNYASLYQYKKIFSNTKIGLLSNSFNLFQICRMILYKNLIKPDFKQFNHLYLTPRLVKWIRKNQMQLIVYTVNDKKDLKRCMDIGVYGIITDNYNFYSNNLEKDYEASTQ